MMTVTEQVLAMVAMAVAIVAILTVGTLIAADIIHLGPRRTEPVHETQSARRAGAVPGRSSAPTLQGEASHPAANSSTQHTITSEGDRGEES